MVEQHFGRVASSRMCDLAGTSVQFPLTIAALPALRMTRFRRPIRSSRPDTSSVRERIDVEDLCSIRFVLVRSSSRFAQARSSRFKAEGPLTGEVTLSKGAKRCVSSA